MPLRRFAPRSLAFRLVVSAAAWSAVALAVAGLLLTELYSTSLERNFDARLTVYQKAITGFVAARSPDQPPEIGSLGEPRFLLPLTGWYWTVRDGTTGATIAASGSLYGEVLDLPPPPADGAVAAGYGAGPGGEALRYVGQTIHVGRDTSFVVVVTGGTDELDDDIAQFRLSAFATLIVFAVGLLAATVFQVRVALKPLEEMRRSLAAIREGRAGRLDGDLPREIAPLGQELNALIETNEAIVERARAHVGNLAHALKTPLSVILNEARADPSPLAAKVVEQAGVMRAEVDRYLERARLAAQRRVVGANAEVMRSVEAIAKVLARAYADRDVAVDLDGPADLKARLERRDLEDLVGNLMDNAFKFGRGRVAVTVRRDPDPAAARPMLTLTVEDDGPGLPPDKYQEVVSRGRRLDETVPGSGLGLSIAEEIAVTGGGRLLLAASPLGGLAVTATLPQG